jgi:hypothetical protein
MASAMRTGMIIIPLSFTLKWLRQPYLLIVTPNILALAVRDVQTKNHEASPKQNLR